MLSYIKIFFIAMLPVIELRGALPFSQALGVPLLHAYMVCILGNMLPVPFIYLFARKLLIWGVDMPVISKFCLWVLNKGQAAGEKLTAKTKRSIYLALMLFVAIPLPGTGAWTGTLAASILHLDVRKTIVAVCAGILIAGLIMMVPSFGVLKFLQL